MARLELIRYVERRPVVVDNAIEGEEPRRVIEWKDQHRVIVGLPQICWENGSTWGEANIWALELATSARKDLETVVRSMRHLVAYAKWLESEGIGWWHFPAREADRCLTRFRGELIRAMKAGEIAPSSAAQRMSTVVRVYRWLHLKNLLSPDWPMWAERLIGIKVTDPFGFEHTLRIASTDLAIPNRKVAGSIRLEDGVLPISRAWMTEITDLADGEASRELALMLRLGFGTGMRRGSITDLKVGTIRNATRDLVAGWYKLSIGPKAHPPVATKFDVSGEVIIPGHLLEQIRAYLTSTRRLKRVARASEEHRDLLFLTRFGKPYTGAQSRAVNVEISRFRRANCTEALKNFHFHRTRATFATELMRVALTCLPVADAIDFVRRACMHKNEATTMKYVRFLETNKAMAEAADAFTEAFLGLAQGHIRRG